MLIRITNDRYSRREHRNPPWFLTLSILVLALVATSLQALRAQELTSITADNAAELETVFSLPTARVNALLFSADNETLFAILEGEVLPSAWSVTTDNLVEQSEFFAESAYLGTSGGRFLHQLRLSDNGQRLMALGSESMIWDVQTGELVGVITHHAHSGDLTDNGVAYTGDLNGLLAGWMTASGLVPDTRATALPDGFTFDPYALLGSAIVLGESIEQVEFISEVGQLFVLTASGRLYRYTPGLTEPIAVSAEIMPPPLLHAGTGDGLNLTHLAVDRASGRVAFTDSNDPPNLYLYDFQGGGMMATRALETPVSCLAYSPEDTILVMGDKSLPTSSLYVLDANTAETIARIATQERITSCIFNPTGSTILTGSDNGITMWDIE
ncbi:MAG: hypothetical protein SF123_23045 [Chloroflexota bacterium]|nr:hypothetical protein [Chloroflexota bacterium]